jgi:hypothetical protein
MDGIIAPRRSGLIIFQPPSYFHGQDLANNYSFTDRWFIVIVGPQPAHSLSRAQSPQYEKCFPDSV